MSKDVGVMSLPYDLPSRGDAAFHYAKVERKADAKLDASLQAFAQRNGYRVDEMWAAVLVAVLDGYGQEGDGRVVVGTAALGAPGRPRCEDPIADLVLGLISSTAVLQVRVDSSMTFQGLLAELAAKQSLPASKAVLHQLAERDLAKLRPAMEVAYGEYPASRISAAGCDLAVRWKPAAGLVLQYNTFRFSRTGAHRVLGHLFELMRRVVAEPGRPISEFDYFTENERECFQKWNETGQISEERGRCLHQLFEARCEFRAATTALVYDGEDRSFSHVDARAEQVANQLLNWEVQPGDRVAVFGERSADLVSAILAIWKLGAACVPVDPSLSKDQIAAILGDAKPVAAVHDRPSLPREFSALRTLNLTKLRPFRGAGAKAERRGVVLSSATACVFYSAVTAGAVAGVQISHKALVNRMAWFWRERPFRRGQIACAHRNICSVDAFHELFVPLCAGVPVVIFGENALSSTPRFLKSLRANRISRVLSTASLLEEVLDPRGNAAGVELPDLDLWVVSGEALRLSTVRTFRRMMGNASLLHGFGATETAGFATLFDTSELSEDAVTVPVGHPIDNTQIRVQNAKGRVAPLGTGGEVWVSGQSVARSYFNRPELTAKFFSQRDGQFWYRTGDFGKWLSDGNLEILGRVDENSLFGGANGHRFEIEQILRSHQDVNAAVVRPQRIASQNELVAYIVPAPESANPRVRELRALLADRLPSALVPKKVIILNEIPRTPNGKVDWASLPAPEEAPAGPRVPTRPKLPITELEGEISNIWGHLLSGVPSRTDLNFFELGGRLDGLVATMAALAKRMDRRFSLQQILDRPTVADLADFLQEYHGTLEDWSALAALNPNGRGTPLFLIHDAGGGCLDFYADIAKRLEPERPVYLMASRGLSGFDEFPDVASMARHYVSELRERYPRQACYVGGIRFGGRVALEMARQMRKTGQEVPLAVMLDTQPRLNSFRDKLARGLFGTDDGEAPVNLPKNVSGINGVADFLTKLAVAQRAMVEKHLDRPYDGKIAFLKLFSPSLFQSSASHPGWSQCATGGVEVANIAGKGNLDQCPDAVAAELGKLLKQHEPARHHS